MNHWQMTVVALLALNFSPSFVPNAAARQNESGQSPLIASGFALDVQNVWLTRSAKLIDAGTLFTTDVDQITYFAQYPESHFELLRGYYYSITWIDPDGLVYWKENLQQAFGHHTLITGTLKIKGMAAERKTGQWKCRFYRKGEFVDEKSFMLVSSGTKVEIPAGAGSSANAEGVAEYMALFAQVLSLIQTNYWDSGLVGPERLFPAAVHRMADLPQSFNVDMRPPAGLSTQTDFLEYFTKLFHKMSANALPGLEGHDGQIILMAIQGMLDGLNDSDAVLRNLSAGHSEKIGGPRKEPKNPDVYYERPYPDRNLHYLRIYEFGIGTADKVEFFLKKIGKRDDSVLILDLRGNTGGLVETAVRIGELLLSGGVILQVDSRIPEQKKMYRSEKRGTYAYFPVIVLTDELTASCAEALAAAIRDNRRGLIVGKPTLGHGKLISVYDRLELGYALTLPIATLITSGGQPIEGMGVRPDVEVDRLSGAEEKSAIAAASDNGALIRDLIDRGDGQLKKAAQLAATLRAGEDGRITETGLK